ncbi:hypothetical protein BC792_12862 [Sphingobacterium allocomposti]|uniref:Uncharacterized protein n=1 Tax=Sphingobacterium allocomposti TaxID=415956 RepID=A0A5S5CZZ5_9SPHI|nr:hypothetical protein BC792_12862 [Sphingobacterium composti Yoo et al. 2007 non Ten et al. 2007]
MFKNLVLLVCVQLASTFSAACQPSDSMLYRQYLIDKQLFSDFEKQHRGFLQTENVTLSYLSWGDRKTKRFYGCRGACCLRMTSNLLLNALSTTDISYFL